MTDREWKLEEVVEMMDEYFVEKQNREFEEEFAKLTRPRKEPKAYGVRQPKTPWYLDPESGGSNPEVKKEGIAYGSELP